MPGIYGERWSVSWGAEPPLYFQVEEAARRFFDEQPGPNVRLHRFDDLRSKWSVVEFK